MTKKIYLLLILFFCTSASLWAQQSYNTARPWTYWWWMGSAADSANITKQLVGFQQAGLGGVHIIPIYGAKGYESKYIPFMSERWLKMVRFTCTEATRLGLGVDLTLGTGWPFGGKHITIEFAAKKFIIRNDSFIVAPTRQMVKRPAPGGEGFVLDYFDKTAWTHYQKQTEFDKLTSMPVRAFYHDSYEAFDANTTTNIFDKFLTMRGYDLKPYVKYLSKTAKSSDSDTTTRILSDYRETMSELLLTQFTEPWANYTATQNKLSRNQAHGSPANLIDLYAAVDIPETESFGSSRFDIPLVRTDVNYEPERYGRPNVLAMKFASSAANLTAKKLVSSETCTWLANHFKVALSQVKPQIDELFVGGVNHIFYHGTTYSPQEAPYPGWLFYASTNFGHTSHLWPDMPNLNRYVANCQSILQESKPDNELLLYFPVYDLWGQAGNPRVGSFPLQMLEVHHSQTWINASSFGKTAQQLTAAGYQYDYISDKFIAELTLTKEKKLSTGKNIYEALVMPPTEKISLKTAQKLAELIRNGAKIVFLEKIPTKIAGFLDFQKQEKILATLATGFRELQIQPNRNATDQGFQNSSIFSIPDIKQEQFAQNNLSYLRKRTADGYVYFVTNLGKTFRSGAIKLSVAVKNIELYDPLTEKRTVIANNSNINLRLLPGQSVFIFTTNKIAKNIVKVSNNERLVPLKTHWKIEFPNLKTIETDTLLSWTDLGDKSHQLFSGMATYKTTFEVTKVNINKITALDLGDLRETAEVILNGKNLGKVWCVPFRIVVPANVLKSSNTLEIKVRNLSSNAMIQIDKERPLWKNFYDINIVDIQYKPLDISKWKPEPSGILGQVKLVETF
jgi:alpha-L-rhamnosidase